MKLHFASILANFVLSNIDAAQPKLSPLRSRAVVDYLIEAEASKSSKATSSTKADLQDVNVYHASFEDKGSFRMEIGPDGRASFNVDLTGLGPLRDFGVTSLAWHLHSGKIGGGATFDATGAEACGLGFTADHYDPYLACGPASTAPLCSDTTATECCPLKGDNGIISYCRSSNVATCEVGDLSGRYGTIDVIEEDTHDVVASSNVLPEEGGYCPGCRNDFLPDATKTDGSALHNTWASIVFHNTNGGARVLCADIELKD